MNNLNKFFLVLMSLFILFVGCKNDNKIKPELFKFTPVSKLNTTSQKNNCNIYVDFSYSMKGYLDTNLGNSVYIKTLRFLEQACVSSPRIDRLSYFRFDCNIDSLKTNNEFYDMKYYKSEGTCIDNVINRLNTKNLNIIISDFCQSKEDIIPLLQNLKSKISENDTLAIGFLSFKSEFDGLIDWGGVINNIEYNTQKYDSDSMFRPFYAMIIGKQWEIENIITEFNKNYKMKFNKILFSNFINQRTSILSTNKPTSAFFINDNFSEGNLPDTLLRQFKIKIEKDTIEIKDNLKIFKNYFSDTSLYLNSNLKLTITPYTFSKNNDSLQKINNPYSNLIYSELVENNPETKGIVTRFIQNKNDKSEYFVFKLSLDFKSFYSSYFDKLTYDSYKLNKNMNKDSLSKDIGNKTINLIQLLNGVANMFKLNNSSISEFYYIIKRK